MNICSTTTSQDVVPATGLASREEKSGHKWKSSGTLLMPLPEARGVYLFLQTLGCGPGCITKALLYVFNTAASFKIDDFVGGVEPSTGWDRAKRACKKRR